LADTVRGAATVEDPQRAERATEISRRFDFNIAMGGYSDLIRELAQRKLD
jgi:hypothetical protein